MITEPEIELAVEIGDGVVVVPEFEIDIDEGGGDVEDGNEELMREVLLLDVCD